MPSVSIANAEATQERIRVRNNAEFTFRRSIWIIQISPALFNIWRHVGAAGGVGEGLEAQKFERRAFHCCVGDGDRQDCVCEIGERGKTVHEDPETWEGSRGGEDTEDKQTRVSQRRTLSLFTNTEIWRLRKNERMILTHRTSTRTQTASWRNSPPFRPTPRLQHSYSQTCLSTSYTPKPVET